MRFRGKCARTTRTRQALRCSGLRYSANMDAHRRELGEHVRDTREAQGIRSQAALAEAAGISARSVAKVELGDPTTGKTVLRALERYFQWPRDSMSEYIARGGDLPQETQDDVDASATPQRTVEMSNEDMVTLLAEMAGRGRVKEAGDLLASFIEIQSEARQRT